MSKVSTLAALHIPFEIRCPYCDYSQPVSEEDVFVLFRRQGVCFVDCKKCYQVFNVDEELKRLT